MVKPPKIRHSKLRKDPVTIDLDPAEVQRVRGEGEEVTEAAPAEEAVPGGGEPVHPNAADEALADSDLKEQESAAPVAEDPALTAAAAAAAEERPLAEESYFGSSDRGASQAPRERRSGQAMTGLLGGAAGAVIALLGAAALQSAGVLPSPRAETAVDSASLDVLRSDIEALRQQVSADEAASDPAVTEALEQSSSRVEALSAELGQLRNDLAALRETAQPSPLGDPAMQAIEARLAELEQGAGAAEANSAALQDLARRIDELNAGLTSSTELNAEQSARLDALEQRLAETSEQVEAQAAEPGMALAVAATALKSAIDRGTPFMMELETYAAIAPDMPQIDTLRDMAARGVPTRSEIEAEAADAASRMVAAAAAPADSNAGFLERLYSSAQSLVEVRPVGSVQGEGPAATVARMEVALREGDYAEAIAEYESLPEASRAAGQEFIEKVRARLAADRLVAEALGGALNTPANEG
jgi:hypothetical protein